ncbi:MAG: PRC-barrel domain-containing protein [Acidimicrobiales bacterium]
MTISLRDLLDRRVVSAADAEEVGSVKTVIPDPSGRRLRAIQVGGGRRHPETVRWTDIDAIGDDAVLVSSTDAVDDTTDERSAEAARGHIDFLGSAVLSTNGTILGSVTDVHVNEGDGSVVALMTDAGRVEGQRIRSIGTFAVVVDHES